MTTCEAIRDRLTLYALGDLDAEATGEVREHVDACQGCRAELEALEQTLGVVQEALAWSDPGVGRLSERHRRRILRTKPLAGKGGVIHWFFTPHVVLKAVASIVVVLGIFLLIVPSFVAPCRQNTEYFMVDGKDIALAEARESAEMEPLELGAVADYSDFDYAYDEASAPKPAPVPVPVRKRKQKAPATPQARWESPTKNASIPDMDSDGVSDGWEFLGGGRNSDSAPGERRRVAGKAGKGRAPSDERLGDVVVFELPDPEEKTNRRLSLGTDKKLGIQPPPPPSAPFSEPVPDSPPGVTTVAGSLAPQRGSARGEKEGGAMVSSDFSAAPAAFDAVAEISSPVVTRGRFGSRHSGIFMGGTVSEGQVLDNKAEFFANDFSVVVEEAKPVDTLSQVMAEVRTESEEINGTPVLGSLPLVGRLSGGKSGAGAAPPEGLEHGDKDYSRLAADPFADPEGKKDSYRLHGTVAATPIKAGVESTRELAVEEALARGRAQIASRKLVEATELTVNGPSAPSGGNSAGDVQFSARAASGAKESGQNRQDASDIDGLLSGLGSEAPAPQFTLTAPTRAVQADGRARQRIIDEERETLRFKAKKLREENLALQRRNKEFGLAVDRPDHYDVAASVEAPGELQAEVTGLLEENKRLRASSSEFQRFLKAAPEDIASSRTAPVPAVRLKTEGQERLLAHWADEPVSPPADGGDVGGFVVDQSGTAAGHELYAKLSVADGDSIIESGHKDNIVPVQAEMLKAKKDAEAKALHAARERERKERDARAEQLREEAERKAQETEAREQSRFKAFGVNPYVSSAVNAFSTFAIDVDTASYELARRYMLAGLLPPAESVRTEEFVNAFDYAYKAPVDQTFRVYTETSPSPFGHGQQMMRIGVKGRRLGREEQRPAVLTFLVDASGSMDRPDRIGLVKQSLRLLVGQLGERDQIAIVQYGSQPRLVLEHTPAGSREQILAAIESMQCGGSTDLEAGLVQAYRVAAGAFVSGAENRVLLLSDGVANMGEGDAETILAQVRSYRDQGITCSVYGFGVGNYDDVMLETLANKGDGVYTYVGSAEDARRVFVDDLAATLNTIAKDVKIQVEYNPAQVVRYRQLGYENRQLRKQDFRDDTVDAGEVGSGQSVTALYELALTGRVQGDAWQSDSGWCAGDVVAVVRVRYRRTSDGRIEEIEHKVRSGETVASFEQASVRHRLAVGVAEFAEILRGSPHAAGSSFESVLGVLRPVAGELTLDRRVQELVGFARMAPGMSRGGFE